MCPTTHASSKDQHESFFDWFISGIGGLARWRRLWAGSPKCRSTQIKLDSLRLWRGHEQPFVPTLRLLNPEAVA